MQVVNINPPKYALPDVSCRGTGNNPYQGFERHAMAVRYWFCVHIDEAAMRSIISPGGEEVSGNAWVNLIEADWHARDTAAEFEKAWIEHVEMGLDKDQFEYDVEVFPEIEGCVDQDVGWMKAHYSGLVPAFYAGMIDPSSLSEYMYVRPPDMLPAWLC